MAATEVFTGTVIAAEWRQGTTVDAYWITLDADGVGTIELRGTDRLNAFPVAGQRIRVATGSRTPKGHYSIRKLRDEIDPATQMPIQIEVL